MISSKVNKIKDQALSKSGNATAEDYSKDIELYKQQIKNIQNELKQDEPILEELEKEFIKTRSAILSNAELSGKDKNMNIRKAFVSYMVERAKLNRVGKAIVFFDKEQAKFVEVVSITKEDIYTKEKREERLIEYREGATVRKMIQLEAKRALKSILPKGEESFILEWLDPYIKTYAPTQKKMYADFFNVYTPNGFLEVKVKNVIDLDNFVDHIMPKEFPIINGLFKNLTPQTEERKYLVNWLSYILNTAQKTRNAVALIGIQGSGKGVLQEQLIEYAIHHDNSYVVSNQDIASTFNGYVENKLFLFFNEIKGSFKESSTQADKIKPFITDSRISLNDKHRKQSYIENYANCMFFSNHDLPFQIEDKDRRYTVIKTAHRTLKSVAGEDFNLSIGEFIEALKKERDNFLIQMKMVKLTKESEALAISLLDNETKKKIKEQTNTVREVVKERILDRDTEWFEETVSEIIDGVENDKIKYRDSEKIVNDMNGNEMVIKVPEIFEYTNAQFLGFLVQEVKQGIFTNLTLRWFTKIYDIESAHGDLKFGKFWNLITNKSDKFSLLDEKGIHRDMRLRMLDVEKVTLDEVYIYGEKYALKSGTTRTLEIADIPF